MYQVSRSLYRELAPRVMSDPSTPTGRVDRQELLDACEATMKRLAIDPRYFAQPTRSLFGQVRSLFGISDQILVWELVRFHVEMGEEFAARLQETLKRECQAFTRQGTPCQREPRPGSDLCPSHRHLGTLFEEAKPEPVQPVAAAG